MALTRLLRTPPLRMVMGFYAVLAVGLWPVPVFNLLHVESAAVVALGAYFAAGLSSLRLFERGATFRQVLAAQEAALLVPWALLTATLPWVPNCGYAEGLLFYGLFPVVSVVLAVAVAYGLPPGWRRGAVLVGIGLAVVVLGPLYDLGLHPQFYTYNHVFGGVLGPIYDEELAVRPGLVVFRGLTLLWALLGYLIGRRWRARRRPERPFRPWVEDGRGALLVVLGIGVVYGFAAPLGLNTPAWYLRQELGGLHRTPHFDLYFDPASLTPEAVQRLGEDHEFHYARLAERLQMEVPGRIASYLYPDAETKARLTGARYTNVAPVWLREPQVHVLLGAYGQVFPHELAHVFSRSFGLPVLRASVSAGLVEGLAVALEPPDGRPTPHEQVAVAAVRRLGMGEGARAGGLAEQVAARLSPLGFWTSRGAVSYTTMGSFVRYLLDVYGPEPFKRAYARAAFEAAYGRPLEVLAAEWERYVLGRPLVARAAAEVVTRRFTVPSLFEKRCPHYVPVYRRRYRAALAALAAADTTGALAALEDALARQPAYPAALAAWAGVHLARGEPALVVARLDTFAAARRVPALAVALGDALALLRRPAAARAAYAAAVATLPLYDHDQRVRVALRRELAAVPEAIRVLASGQDPAMQARRLATLTGPEPARTFLLALLHAAAGAEAEALALLQAGLAVRPARPTATSSAASPDVLPDVLPEGAFQRQGLVWTARLLARTGNPEAARQQALAAARSFADAGDANTAAALRVWAEQVQWTARWRAEQPQPTHTRAGRRGP
ncbi:hypothetical protein AWN76_007085 [Rhodothermaceae bacterium RA]|nr:hypothetical protein AWN76_007085 [Rhodothermaceae bacterium RA]